MQNLSQYFVAISSLTRQFLNCWLEYVLSQPVDFDISVMLQFLRSYIGLPMLQQLINSNTAIVDEGYVTNGQENEVLPELITQESYS